MRTIFEGGFSFEGNPQSESIKSCCKNIKPHTACNRRIFTVRNEVTKVMFLHMYVILFTGGVAIPACIAGGIPACLAAGVPAPRGCMLWGGACSRGVPDPGGVCSRGCLLWGVPALMGAWPSAVCVETPPRKQMATVADGTHPNGMHSCLCTVITCTLNEK